MTELIILDCYGTILKADNADGVVRPGLEDFLEHYQEKKIVVFSDGKMDAVEYDLTQAGLKGRFVKIYGAESLDGERLKNLEKAITGFGISRTETMFIGDNGGNKDYRSAKKYGINFIKVPQFRDRIPLPNEMVFDRHVKYEKHPFSFTSLIGKQ